VIAVFEPNNDDPITRSTGPTRGAVRLTRVVGVIESAVEL